MNWLPLLADPAVPLREATERFQLDYIRAAIEKCGGNLRETSRLLCIGYSTLKGSWPGRRSRDRRPHQC